MHNNTHKQPHTPGTHTQQNTCRQTNTQPRTHTQTHIFVCTVHILQVKLVVSPSLFSLKPFRVFCADFLFYLRLYFFSEQNFCRGSKSCYMLIHYLELTSSTIMSGSSIYCFLSYFSRIFNTDSVWELQGKVSVGPPCLNLAGRSHSFRWFASAVKMFLHPQMVLPLCWRRSSRSLCFTCLCEFLRHRQGWRQKGRFSWG